MLYVILRDVSFPENSELRQKKKGEVQLWQYVKKCKCTESTNNFVLKCEWLQYGGLFGFCNQDRVELS